MARAGFPRRARLRRACQFRAVFRQGCRYSCPGFVLIAAPGQYAHARLGLALAKRQISRAVERNRIKRVLRESFRGVRLQLGSVDIVVLARRHTAAFENTELFTQLSDIWPTIARLGAVEQPGPLSGAPDEGTRGT